MLVGGCGRLENRPWNGLYQLGSQNFMSCVVYQIAQLTPTLTAWNQGAMTSDDSESRSSTDETGHDYSSGDGVGARQTDPPLPQDGGGYQDICTTGEPDSGALQLRELQRMGLPRFWLDVAAGLGTARFLELWRMLDRPELIEQEGRLRITIPRFGLYLRYQRNRYIQELAREGRSAREIQGILKRELGERISKVHVWRLMRG